MLLIDIFSPEGRFLCQCKYNGHPAIRNGEEVYDHHDIEDCIYNQHSSLRNKSFLVEFSQQQL